jgi:hypothetical protein
MTAGAFSEKFASEDFWVPPELSAELIAFIATGALDQLSGRYIHVLDDWHTLSARSQDVLDRVNSEICGCADIAGEPA